MKTFNKLFLAVLMVIPMSLFAQQDYQFTQFNFNKLAINPAYAGSRDVLSLTALYRDQWSGFDGAPKTFSINGHTPLAKDKVGLGLHVFNDRLGIASNTGAYITYAYRIRMDNKDVLSLGLQTGILALKQNYTKLNPIDPDDANLQADVSNVFGNAGVGAYYYGKNYYLGLSVPHLVKNQLNDTPIAGSDVATLYRHVYAMGGYVFDIASDVKLRPSVLVKHAGLGNDEVGIPLDVDFNLATLLFDKLWLGVAYRLDDSFDAMIEYIIDERFMIGYAYDHTLTELNSYHNGSHEIMLRYEFNQKPKKHVTPRYIKYF